VAPPEKYCQAGGEIRVASAAAMTGRNPQFACDVKASAAVLCGA
jgi:hypothetical protein